MGGAVESRVDLLPRRTLDAGIVERPGHAGQFHHPPRHPILPMTAAIRDATPDDAAAIAALSANEKRHTMHGAPLWARSATVAAGPIFNFILALVVYWGLILWTGVATERPVIGTVATLPGAAQPLASGDQVLTLNGVETPDLESYLLAARDLPAAASVDYRILRDGTEQMVTAAHPMPPLVASVQLKSAALAAGLEEGDVILAANGKPHGAVRPGQPGEQAAFTAAMDTTKANLRAINTQIGDLAGAGAPRFQADGFARPPRLDLVGEGRFAGWLVSPRSVCVSSFTRRLRSLTMWTMASSSRITEPARSGMGGALGTSGSEASTVGTGVLRRCATGS